MWEGRGRIRPVARHRGHAHPPLTIGMLVGGDELDAAPAALRNRRPMLVGNLKEITAIFLVNYSMIVEEKGEEERLGGGGEGPKTTNRTVLGLIVKSGS